VKYNIKLDKGLSIERIKEISKSKNEPKWMLEFRLTALDTFYKMDMPEFGPDLSNLDIDEIYYYIRILEKNKSSWDDIPEKIKTTFDKLGIPKAEQTILAGVGAQFESELVYKNLKKEWKEKGVIFSDINDALINYPSIVEKYFATLVKYNDNKFAALNSAVFSGGSFVYVPENIKITMPLQAYFRINQESMGQFERTLIIAEKGSYVEYIEGCSAPIYKKSSLHSAVVEIFAMESSCVKYITIQNWAKNVYNLVTKRAIAYKNSNVSWIDGNFGSKITMKYPSVILKEEGSKAEILSISLAGKNQIQDTGAKVIHLANRTSSMIVSKSVSKDNGSSTYRGLVRFAKNVSGKSKVQCDAIMLSKLSNSKTYPTIISNQNLSNISHEATIYKVNEEQLYYLNSRGLNNILANGLIINGFLDSFIKQIPLEYAIELNRLINLEMEDSIG